MQLPAWQQILTGRAFRAGTISPNSRWILRDSVAPRARASCLRNILKHTQAKPVGIDSPCAMMQVVIERTINLESPKVHAHTETSHSCCPG